MDSAITAGIIGAIATDLAAIISPILSRWFENKKLLKISPSPVIARKDALSGIWVGTYIQQTGKREYIGEHPAELEIRKEQGGSVGSLQLGLGSKNQSYAAHVINTIFDGTLFKVDYVNKKSNTTHFGTIFGKISGDGESITGSFVGYGFRSEQFVRGSIELKKSKNA